MAEPLQVLSLGAGVQSSVVMLLSCRGELCKLDCAIFADTQWEPPAIYSHLDWLTEQAAAAGIPVHRVTAGDLRADALRSMVRGTIERHTRPASMPLYTRQADGSIGQIRRQCTREYKIDVIEKFIKRELLGVAKGCHAPAGAVEQWFGISVDEMRRMRQSANRWKTHIYPLVFDRRMNRADCLTWFKSNYPGRPLVKSACVGCPYHSDAEWRLIKSDPVLWADAVSFDRAIRQCGGMRGETFIHRSGLPLDEVDLSSAEDRGQRNWLDECAGICGV